MASNLVAVSRTSLPGLHLSSIDVRRHVLITQTRSRSRNLRRTAKIFTIRCLKEASSRIEWERFLSEATQPSTISKSKLVNRLDFPADFLFGCATSAIQTEGAGDEGGRGPSTWDMMIQDGSGVRRKAVDSYHRYKVAA